MTNGLCIELCGGNFPFVGIFNTSCYCVDRLEDARFGAFPDTLCNTLCPGNPREVCGSGKQKHMRSEFLLSMYTLYGKDLADEDQLQLPPSDAEHNLSSPPPNSQSEYSGCLGSEQGYSCFALHSSPIMSRGGCDDSAGGERGSETAG